MKRIQRISVLFSVAVFLTAPWVSATAIDIRILGLKVGVLDVSTYSGGKVGDTAQIDIIANFDKTGQDPGGQGLLDWAAPLGTTYLQTVLFTTNQQQQIFRTAAGNNLTGTFADPPIGGYMLRSGAVENFGGDNTPWYSSINPSGVAGDIPPDSFGAEQFRDTPSIGFGVINGIAGLAGVLNGQNGRIAFETALVGSCNQPANPLNGVYTVCVLGQFYWGFNFTYNGGAAPFDVNDYDVALSGLTVNTVQTVSPAFKSAFDKAGANAAVEWNVHFVTADACVPEPSTFLLVLPALAAILWHRKHGVAARRG